MNFYLSSLDLKKVITRSAITLILGILLCIFPSLAINTIILILGGTILFVGIVSFLSIFTFKEGRPTGINYFNLAITTILGLAMIIFPETFVRFLMAILGILLMIGGLGQISSLISVRKWGITSNAAEYILGILLFVLGLLVCINPKFMADSILVVFGAGAIFYGITNLIILLRLRKAVEKSGKVIVHGNIEDVDYTITEDRSKSGNEK